MDADPANYTCFLIISNGRIGISKSEVFHIS